LAQQASQIKLNWVWVMGWEIDIMNLIIDLFLCGLWVIGRDFKLNWLWLIGSAIKIRNLMFDLLLCSLWVIDKEIEIMNMIIHLLFLWGLLSYI